MDSKVDPTRWPGLAAPNVCIKNGQLTVSEQYLGADGPQLDEWDEEACTTRLAALVAEYLEGRQ